MTAGYISLPVYSACRPALAPLLSPSYGGGSGFQPSLLPPSPPLFGEGLANLRVPSSPSFRPSSFEFKPKAGVLQREVHPLVHQLAKSFVVR